MSRKIILLTVLAFLAALIAAPAFAREDTKLDLNIKSLDASKFPVIQAYVTVTDRDGAYYRNLTESNFAVAENRFKLDSFMIESSLKNMHVVLCLDNSASMKKDMAELQRAAFTFIKGLDPTDKCSIITFNNKTSVLQDFTNDKYALSNAVFQMRARGGTLLYDSLFTAINKCAIIDGKKAIVLFTDGKDESYSGSKPFSRHTLEEALAHARQVEVPIYVVGIGQDFNENILSAIANESEGTYYYAPSPYELSRLFKQIVQSFKTYYKIVFATPCQTRDMTARLVEIEATIGDMLGHNQVLYLAPGAKSSVATGYGSGSADDGYVPIKDDCVGCEFRENAKFKHLRSR
mgnify:CR=1 FL=1